MSATIFLLASLFFCMVLSVDMEILKPMEYVSEMEWTSIKTTFESALPDEEEKIQESSGMTMDDVPKMQQYMNHCCRYLSKKIHTGDNLVKFIGETASYIKDNIHTYKSYHRFLNTVVVGILKISLTDEQKSDITEIMRTFYNDMLRDDAYKMMDIQDNTIKDKNKQCVLKKFLQIFYLLNARQELVNIYWDMIKKKNDLPQPNIQIFNLMIRNIDIFDVNERIQILGIIYDDSIKMSIVNDYLYRELFEKIAKIYPELDKKDNIIAKETVTRVLTKYIENADIKDWVIKQAVAAYDAIGIRFTNKEWDIIKDKIYGDLIGDSTDVSEIEWERIKTKYASVSEPENIEVSPQFAKYIQENNKMKTYFDEKLWPKLMRDVDTGHELVDVIRTTILYIKNHDHTLMSYNTFLDMISKAIIKNLLTYQEKSDIVQMMKTFYVDMFEDDAYKMMDIQDNPIKDNNRQSVLIKFLDIFYLLNARQEIVNIYWQMINKEKDLPQPSVQIFNLMVQRINIFDSNERIQILGIIHEHAKMGITDDYLYIELFRKITTSYHLSMKNDDIAGKTVKNILDGYITKAGIKDFVIKSAVEAYNAINVRFTEKQWKIIKDKTHGHS